MTFSPAEINDRPKFFGRRKGRTIHKAKSFLLESFLPCLSVDLAHKKHIGECFKQEFSHFALEIGFGDGSHLAEISLKHKDTGFLGVEVYKNGVANLLSLLTGIKEGTGNKMDTVPQLSAERCDNVRVFDDDVRLLFASLPDNSFDKIYLLFPDPWPKNKHADRRFINPKNLDEIARLLKKDGILQIATDHPIYKVWVLRTMSKDSRFVWTAKTSDDWRNPPKDWCETKYQRKAILEGRRPVFFEYRRI